MFNKYPTVVETEWLEIPDIGTIEVLYKRHKNAISARIKKSKQGIMISAPVRCSQSDILKFIEDNKEWFIKASESFKHTITLSFETINQIAEEAAKYLPQRIEYLSKQHNIPYNKLTLKILRSKWGSCSSNDDIVLNLVLMYLPKHLIDFVILHELAHVKHKNHSPKFWEDLEKLCGDDPKKLKKEIAQYSNISFGLD